MNRFSHMGITDDEYLKMVLSDKAYIEEESGQELWRAVCNKCADAGAFPCVVGKTDEILIEQYKNADSLLKIKNKFRDERNPLYVLDALALSFQVDFNLPIWVHHELSDAVKLYYERKGDSTLDEILGLKHGRGRNRHPLKQKVSKEKQDHIAFYIKRLHQYFGFTLPVTFFLLSTAGIESYDLSEPRIFYSRDRLEEIYKNDKSKFYFDEPGPNEGKYPELDREGYADMIISNEKALKEAGLYDSAIRTVKQILKGS